MKKYEASHFCKMFPNTGKIKHLTEKVTAVASFTHIWIVVDTLFTELQRSTTLKVSH